MSHKLWSIAAALLLICSGLDALAAEPGVTGTKIVFGQAAALEGPIAELGRGMREGLLAAFNEANATGGVAGRKLELISRNDDYEPEESIAATRQLIEQDHVFALAGAVGTPTTMAAEPVASEAGVPLLGPFTGAEFLRHPDKRNVVNIRASYFEETDFIVDHLVKDSGITKIGILYQDDSFGRAGLVGVMRALEKHGLKLAVEGTFVRNTRAVKMALATIRKADPQAVILIGAHRPSGEFVKLARELRFQPVFAASSFTAPAAFASEFGPAATGVFFTQVVPQSDDAELPVVADYRAALAAFDPHMTPNAVSLEGYIVGRLIVAALQAAGPQPTRRAFLDAIHGHRFDFGGFVLDYSGQSNQAAAHISLAVIGADGKARVVAGFPSATN